MLADPSAENDHACFLSCPRELVQVSDIFDNINDKAGRSEGVKVDHVAERTIGQGRAKYWNVILLGKSLVPKLHRRSNHKRITTLYAQ